MHDWNVMETIKFMLLILCVLLVFIYVRVRIRRLGRCIAIIIISVDSQATKAHQHILPLPRHTNLPCCAFQYSTSHCLPRCRRHSLPKITLRERGGKIEEKCLFKSKHERKLTSIYRSFYFNSLILCCTYDR